MNPLLPAFAELPEAARQAVLAELRDDPAPRFLTLPDAPGGFHLVTRYADVAAISRNPAVFASAPAATTLSDLRESVPSMINLDGPPHARLRRIVSRSFTPKTIRRLEAGVEASSRRIVDGLLERGPCDFVAEVAAPLPLEIICTMTGVPASLRPEVRAAAGVLTAVTVPGHGIPAAEVKERILFLSGLMGELAELRRREPGDDLVTTLITAGADGEALTGRELASFFRLLVLAGNETTRNALSHALLLLTEHGGERARLLGDLGGLLPTAVEEIVRYATPVTWMRRNLAADVPLGGRGLRAGETVVVHYGAANRDERAFTAPQVFDTGRSPNPHLGFGGPGPHFCLGAHLARSEITVLLRELLTRAPGIRADGEPVREAAGLVNAVASLPCAF